MILTAADWVALQKAYENGQLVRVLGREFGVNDKTIRDRAKRDGWVKPDKAKQQQLHHVAQRAGIEGPVAKAVLRRASQPLPPRETPQGPRSAEAVREDDLRGAFEEAIELLGDAVFEARQRLMDRANSHTLGNIDRLQALFDRQMDLLTVAASMPLAEDEPAQHRKSEALGYLLAGRGDSIGGHMAVLMKLAIEIQTVTRKALGITEMPSQHQHKHLHTLTAAGSGELTTSEERMQVMARMSTAQLSQIWHASRLLEGNIERPGIPLPPSDPGGQAAYYPQE
jgi:hypothetical protein